MSTNVVIIIPVYKKYHSLNLSEFKLFEQIKTVFKNREITILLPEILEKDWKQNSGFKTICFKNFYFKDKFSYSKLLCRKKFYESFSDFEYIQIIQLDCWIFNDQLNYFTSLGLDYIGAPWMVGGLECKPQEKLWKVGNGGFSLRRVKTFISLLDKIENTFIGKRPVFEFKAVGIKSFLKNAGFKNNLRYYLKDPPGEDIFWSLYIPLIFQKDEFKIADPITAAHYSFESLPDFLFKNITTCKLPMGCHNWMNNNPRFWKKHINY